MTTYVHRWACLACDEGATTDTDAAAHKAAEKHTKAVGHSTRAGTEVAR